MADAQACAGRVERLRELMAERGYDAVILRNNPRPALAHRRGAHLRRRGRPHRRDHGHGPVAPHGLPATTTPSSSAWARTAPGPSTWRSPRPAAWAARRLAAERVRVAAVEDTCDLAFYDDLLVELSRAGVACLTPRLHGDICDLRMVKDAEEVALMQRAQEITDEAFAPHLRVHQGGHDRAGDPRRAGELHALPWRRRPLLWLRSSPPATNGANPHAQPGERQVQLGDLHPSWTTAPATTTTTPT